MACSFQMVSRWNHFTAAEHLGSRHWISVAPTSGRRSEARYMTLETIAPMRDDLTLMVPAVAA
jgi:hypothetical protein